MRDSSVVAVAKEKIMCQISVGIRDIDMVVVVVVKAVVVDRSCDLRVVGDYSAQLPSGFVMD